MMKRCIHETRLAFLLRVAIAHIRDHAPEDITEYDETECDGASLAADLQTELDALPAAEGTPEPAETPPCPNCFLPITQRAVEQGIILECRRCDAGAHGSNVVIAYRHLKYHLARRKKPEAIYHQFLGKVTIDDQCRRLQELSPRPDTTFVLHDGEIKEISTACLSNTPPEPQ